MNYAKQALSLEQQADLLLARGLIADRAELIDRLKVVNYYRLSGYLYPFRVRDPAGNVTDSFLPGTTFEAVWRRYNFDRRLRIILLDAIERIEVAVRTRLVYHFAQSHGPFGHLNEQNLPGFKLRPCWKRCWRNLKALARLKGLERSEYIIVPEGIIFQCQGSYTELRKMLVENSLVAVISLPAGVFNPYSGVKTSILILDKSLARQADTVGFFNVENDGFGLGAQRRPIEKNDLPQVQAEMEKYLHSLRGGVSRANGPADFRAKGPTPSQPGATPQENAPKNVKGLKARPISAADGSGLQPSDFLADTIPGALPQAGMGCAVGAPLTTALIVPKEKIAANGDYNLSGERYREGDARTSNYPLVPIGELCELINGRAFKPEDWKTEASGGLPIVRIQNLNTPDSEFNYYTGQVSDRHLIEPDELLFSWSGSRGTSFGAHIWRGKKAVLNQHIFKVGFDESRVTKMYLLHALNRAVTEVEENLHGGVGLVHITKGNLEKIEIPLPPLEVQKEIVAEIDGYQKVINGARAVIDHYRPHIPTHPDWPIIELSEICSFKNGLNFDKTSSGHTVKIIGVSDFQSNLYAPLDDLDEVHLAAPLGAEYLVEAGDILFVRSNGNPDLVVRSLFVPQPREPTTFSGFTIRGRIHDERALPLFFAHFFKSRDFAEMIKTVGQGANIRNLSQGILNELKVPLPPFATQQAIVAEIEAEQALVAANRELITRFERKIQGTLARIWGEEETA